MTPNKPFYALDALKMSLFPAHENNNPVELVVSSISLLVQEFRVGYIFPLCGKIEVLDKDFARNSVIFNNQISNKMRNFDRKSISLTGNSSCG